MKYFLNKIELKYNLPFEISDYIYSFINYLDQIKYINNNMV